MLGRFLELSVATGDILGSYEFYRRLGFTGADAAEVYPYRYGVVTDGRVALGLHEAALPALSLTFVLPDLATRLPLLRGAGITTSYEHLSDERFNELGLVDPDGNVVRLIEARTYSPVDHRSATLAGWFEELVLPVRDLAASVAFWERLGFIRTDEEAASASLTSDHLSLALRAGLPRPTPWLHFTVEDPGACRARLDAAGFARERVPPAVSSEDAIWLVAPEGTPLLLTVEAP